MHNLKTVIDFEFLRTIKKKSFWISLLAFPVMMVGISMLLYISGKAANDSEEEENKEKFSLVVLDESGLVSQQLLTAFEAKKVATKEIGINSVKDGTTDAFFYYPKNPVESSVEVFGKDEGFIKNGKYTTIAKMFLQNSVLQKLGSEEQIAIAQGQADTELTAYKDGEVAPGFERVIAPGAFLILFYILIILLGNQMLASTTEEKENRVIEMILTTVHSRTLIIGKILAMILLGVLQIVVIMVPMILIVVFFGDQLDLPNINLSQIYIDPVQITVGAILFVGSFLLFTGILVTIGAVMPTAKEASSFFGFMMFSMFVPLYAFMALVSDSDQLIVKVFSFFPLTAPVTLLLRNAVGNLSTIETIFGVSILIVSSVLTLLIATRAFRYGTLEYSRRLSFKEIFRRS